MSIWKRKEKKFPLMKCPYCFYEFSHDKVCFKAMTAFDEEKLEEEKEKITDFYGGVETDEVPIIGAVMEKFVKKRDGRYESFWKNYRNHIEDWEYRDYPVITPERADMMKDGSGYRADVDGFTNSVVDYFDKESRVRLCPRCHNELPLGYGKHPVIFISVVGVKDSGKTVYLSQLMKNFGTIMARLGISAIKVGNGVDRYLRENRVARDELLPESTKDDCLSEPLIYTIIKEEKKYTLVFYDIAGKNCVQAERMERYGPFVRKSDGLIWLLDPGQFIPMGRQGSEPLAEPGDVLSAMNNAFLEADYKEGCSCRPLAVVFTKSDLLRNGDYVQSREAFFKKVDYSEKGFDAAAHHRSHEGIQEWFRTERWGKETLLGLKKCFVNYHFFAASMLENGAEKASIMTPEGKTAVRWKPLQVPGTYRIEEPLLWILLQMEVFSAWNRRE